MCLYIIMLALTLRRTASLRVNLYIGKSLFEIFTKLCSPISLFIVYIYIYVLYLLSTPMLVESR